MFPQDEIKYETSVAVDGTPSHLPAFYVDLDLGVTQNITQYPLRHMTYAPGKFEVAMSYDLGGDNFFKKIHYLTFDLCIKVT